MLDRETILPLSIGALIAVLVHLLLLPAMAQTLRQDQLLQTWPDLQVEVDAIVAKGTLGMDFVGRIVNRGDAPTPRAAWRYRMLISKDEKPSDDDEEMAGGRFEADAPLAPGESRDISFVGDFFRDVVGKYFIIILVDPDDAIDEGPHEKNNTVIIPIEFKQPEPRDKPDLVMLAAASPSRAKPGETITIEYAIGGATDSEPIVLSWFDGVFLSKDDQLSADDVLLSAAPGPAAVLIAGQAYSRSAQVVIDAAAVAGQDQLFLLFVADHLNRIEELDEKNNLMSRSIRVIRDGDPQTKDDEKTKPQGPSDLHIPVFSAPDSAMNGESLSVDYIVANQGEGATKVSQWRDRVYLSLDQVLDENDKLIATFDRTSALAAGGYYSSRMTGLLDLPEEESGPRFLIIKTDADNAEVESDEINNIRIRPIEINQLVIGKDKPEDVRTAVAWIPYDDFRKLLAVSSETEQPALQSKVDPIKGAPTPRDPSPPSPPQPQPVEVVQAKKSPEPADPTKASKQPEPSEEPADPAKRIEAKTPVVTQATRPIEQPKAEALAMLPVAPRPQPPALGPAQTGQPVKQPEAQTPMPAPGTPSNQTEVALPTPIAPTIDPAAAFVRPGSSASESKTPSKSDVTTASPNPTQQPRADTPQPMPGDPTKLAPSVAPPSTSGEPTKLVPSETPQPTKDGSPANSPKQDGKDDPQVKPSPSADDNAKAAPKATDEKAMKPVPPTQPSNPTSAPRDESDVPPTILEDKQYVVEPGGVITRPGIQIVTTIPDITTPSWLVSGPTAVNPIVRLTFDKQGNVKRADLIRSTGHANLDSPIQAAFFNFRAKGEALKKVRDTFSIEIKLLLRNERE